MKIVIADSKQALGQQAAEHGADLLRRALKKKGTSNIIVATGASQFEMLATLVREKIDWTKVTAFHLDEYVGLPITYPASFRKYLWERFVSKLPLPLANFHYINAEQNPNEECKRLAKLNEKVQIDVAFIGIGENAHIAPGAILGGLIVVLASLASGWVAGLSAFILFLGVHALESYVLTPIIQSPHKRRDIYGFMRALGCGVYGSSLILREA